MNACPHTVWLNRAAAWPAEDREPGWRCRACGIVRDDNEFIPRVAKS